MRIRHRSALAALWLLYVSAALAADPADHVVLPSVVQGEVVRYELPNLSALNFVMDQALGGGVTRSLALDAHGKSLSSALLDLDIVPAPDGK